MILNSKIYGQEIKSNVDYIFIKHIENQDYLYKYNF